MPHTIFEKLIFPVEEGEEEMSKQVEVEVNAHSMLYEEKALDVLRDHGSLLSGS